MPKPCVELRRPATVGSNAGWARAARLVNLRSVGVEPWIRPAAEPDPIGLAGGLVFYGNAGCRPINFADPFGLRPICEIVGMAVTSYLAGPAVDAINPGGYVVSNPAVLVNGVLTWRDAAHAPATCESAA